MEPAVENKVVSSKLLFESTLEAFWFDVLPLFVIPFLITLINNKDWESFKYYSYFILTSYIILWVSHAYTRKWDFEAKAVFLTWLEKKYRKSLILKDNLSLDVIGTGKVQSIVGKGMNVWIDTTWNVIHQIPKLALTIISGFWILKDFGAVFILFFLAFILFCSFGFYYFRKIKLEYDESMNKISDEENADSVRVIMSRTEIIYSGQEKKEVDRLANYGNRYWNIWKKSAKYDFISDWFISGTSTMLPILGILLIIYTGKISELETSFLVAFVYFASRFAFNMYAILWMVRVMLDNYPKIQNFINFLDEVPQIKNYESGNEFKHGNGEIVFKNVSFSYKKGLTFSFLSEVEAGEENLDEEDKNMGADKKILENFNLKIEGGTKIALVGKSGGGKTTIAKLATGYLRPTEGDIFVDEQNLKEVSLKSLYKKVGYLTQEASIFDGTILENLLYATNELDKRSKVTTEKVKEALEKANCAFVYKLEKGINTHVGERGIRLSGGERQRLAIAKLFLKNPEIIILDEPTSALDSFSEELITKSLEELFKGRTVLIIAHRLQTVKNADRILVLEDGGVVEDGNHAQLCELGGRYQEMLSLQSGF